VFFRDPVRVAQYVRPDELHLVFNFTLLFEDWTSDGFRSAIDRTISSLGEVGATPSWVLESHDVTRLPTRYGGGAEGLRRARAAALLLLALPGTAFLYEGQELGLEEAELPDDARQDPIFFRTNGERLGRDGCRVPLPWTRSLAEWRDPWLPQPESFRERSVEAEEADGASMLALWRAAIAARPSGAFEWVDAARGTLAFSRGDLLCVVNVDGEPAPVPRGGIVLASEPLREHIPAGAAAWISKR
jgi:alpha-glucosidase